MKRTFEIDGIQYTVKITPTTSKSNYNRFAHLFKAGEKMPILGHTCKESTPINEVIEHFKMSVKAYEREMREEGHPIIR